MERDDKLKQICVLLDERIECFNWTGFYFADLKQRKLHLGPFVGAPTEHIIINYGVGICGQTAESEDTFVVQDVNRADNYLACSLATKAEIVIPIFNAKKEFVAELDIDSHYKNPFSDEDRKFLEQLCKEISFLFDK